ncbi:MAG: CDP-diacylglycerol--glycerol-3-phosphate 3-phosphatidyltransferase [Thermoguttaceae bacterium]
MNIPNFLTSLRVVFAIVVFICIGTNQYEAALFFFILASLTDFLDGWWARKFNQITIFGRVMDPFADKLLICGTFICLLTKPELPLLQSWMVVVIVARELLVTSLRALIESEGGDFSAKWIGKWKMFFQCFTAMMALLLLICVLNGNAQLHQFLDAHLPSDTWPIYALLIFGVLLWGTLLITIYSGVTYCINAIKIISKKERK